MGSWTILVVLAVAVLAAVLAVAGAVLVVATRRRRQRAEFQKAQTDFRRQREHLEADFLIKASHSGKPRGLSWKDCDFSNDVLFARDKKTSAVWAFTPMTVAFEAIAGGGMEEVEAVGNLRAATAVFRWHHATWSTDGRTLFNLEPAEAIRHFQHELELQEPEVAPGK